MDTITLDPEEEVRKLECFFFLLLFTNIKNKSCVKLSLQIDIIYSRVHFNSRTVHVLCHLNFSLSFQDVDLVHCRIGKIEGLEVLQKAKVRMLDI